MELEAVRMEIPEGANLIIGQAHFIKTAEDLYEAMVNSVPGAKFAIAFNEASGPCLVRVESNDDALRRIAVANAMAIGAGHVFVLLMREAFPINVLNRVKDCFEVCGIYCATANPVEVIVARTPQGAECWAWWTAARRKAWKKMWTPAIGATLSAKSATSCPEFDWKRASSNPRRTLTRWQLKGRRCRRPVKSENQTSVLTRAELKAERIWNWEVLTCRNRGRICSCAR